MSSETNNSPRARLEAFCGWMKARGITWNEDLMEFRWENGVCDGYGIVAKQDVGEGVCLCTIPKEMVLSVKTSPIAELLEQNELMGAKGVAVAIMHEWSRGTESQWYPYLQVMPESVDLPLYWSEEDVKLLQGTQAAVSVAADKERAEEEWSETVGPLVQAHPDLFIASVATPECYKKALALFASRAFQVDSFHGDSMLPLADTFNHKTAAEHVHIEGAGDGETECDTIVEEDEDAEKNEGANQKAESNGALDRHTLEIVTVRKASSGDELFNTFGERPNSSLLCKYGFAEADNPFDNVHISNDLVMEVAKERLGAKRVDERLPLIGAHSDFFAGDDDGYFCLIDDGSFCENLMMFLYVLHVKPKVAKPWLEDPLPMLEALQAVDMDDILSVDGVCETLTALVQARVALYPESKIQEEEERIKMLLQKQSKEFSAKERHELYALIVRVGEKKALKNAYESVFDTQEGEEEEEEEEEVKRKAEEQGGKQKKQRK